MARPRKSSKQRSPRRRVSARKQSVFVRKSRFILPWPYIVFVLLCIAVLLAGWTFQAQADSLSVTAKVPATLPSRPAVVTSPTDGTHFSQAPIAVLGTCPLNGYYVEIYDNDIFAGTAICTGGATFSLDIGLFPGADQLQAHIFNITDDEGPLSNIVTVYYDVPQQPTNTPTSPTTPSVPPSSSSTPSSTPATVPPFEISTDFTYKGYEVGQIIYWTFTASGGNPPYAINVDWGDGSNSVFSQKETAEFTIGHRYKAAGSGKNGSYVIKVTGSDIDGRKAYLQLFVAVNPSGLPSMVANNLPTGPHISNNWLFLAWPAYLVLLLMLTSFWLGEREELIDLKKKGLLRGRQA